MDRLREILEIVEVLVSASRSLVTLEMMQAAQAHFEALEDVDHARRVTLGKIHTGDAGRNLDANRRYAHADDLILRLEKLHGEFGDVEPKLLQCRDDLRSIAGMCGD